jgi:hypothetical protein
MSTNKDRTQGTKAGSTEIDQTLEGVEDIDTAGNRGDEKIDLTANAGSPSVEPADSTRPTTVIDAAPAAADTAAGSGSEAVTDKPAAGDPDEDKTADLAASGITSGTKKLLYGAAGLIALALIVGYFALRSAPQRTATVDTTTVPAVPTRPAGDPASAPANPVTVPNNMVPVIGPVPVGVDASGCKPEDVVVDRANKRLLFPTSCSKIVFEK